jgi:hypothetical protein
MVALLHIFLSGLFLYVCLFRKLFPTLRDFSDLFSGKSRHWQAVMEASLASQLQNKAEAEGGLG